MANDLQLLVGDGVDQRGLSLHCLVVNTYPWIPKQQQHDALMATVTRPRQRRMLESFIFVGRVGAHTEQQPRGLDKATRCSFCERRPAVAGLSCQHKVSNK